MDPFSNFLFCYISWPSPILLETDQAFATSVGLVRGVRMSALYHTETSPQLICWDRTYYHDFDAQLEAYKTTRTVYVGNLSFFTTEAQIRETFSVVGPVRRVIMGLNNITKTPCGFCFVEYYTREHYQACLKYLSDTICDGEQVLNLFGHQY